MKNNDHYFNYNNIIRDIPKILLPQQIKSANYVNGGFNNKNILINKVILVKKFLITNEYSDPVFQRFLREKNALSFYSSQHVPKLINSFSGEGGHYIVRKWVEGRPLQKHEIEVNINILVKALASIHCIDKYRPCDYDYNDVIRKYLEEYSSFEMKYLKTIIDDEKYQQLPSITSLNEIFKAISLSLDNDNLSKEITRIHGDLLLTNILLTPDGKIFFIDWEYSTISSPLIDLAYFISQNDIPKSVVKLLIDRYRETTDFHFSNSALKSYLDLINLMTGLWYFIRFVRESNRTFDAKSSNIPAEKSLFLALDKFNKLKAK